MSHVNVISIPDLQKSPFFFSNLKSTLHKVDLSSLHQSKNKNSRSRRSERFVDIFCGRMKMFKQHTSVTILCCSLGSLLPTVTSALPQSQCAVSVLGLSITPLGLGAARCSARCYRCHTHTAHGSCVTQIHSVTLILCHTHIVSHTHQAHGSRVTLHCITVQCHTHIVSHSHSVTLT